MRNAANMAARRRSIENLPSGELSDERSRNLYALVAGPNVRLWLIGEVPTTSAPRPVYPQQPTFKPHIGFRADYVCFTSESGRGISGSRESVVDPNRSSSAMGCAIRDPGPHLRIGKEPEGEPTIASPRGRAMPQGAIVRGNRPAPSAPGRPGPCRRVPRASNSAGSSI